MKLYYVPRTRASRPRWVLEELGIPYELGRLDPAKGETRTPEHLARQPLGHVPVLEDGELRLFESLAICLHLAEKVPGRALLPPPGTAARALAYQWIFFAATELEPAISPVSTEARKPEAERNQAAMEEGRARFRKAAGVLEPVLADRPFVLGQEFSVADVVLGSVLSWGRSLGALGGLAAVEAYLARLKQRPAWKRSIAD